MVNLEKKELPPRKRTIETNNCYPPECKKRRHEDKAVQKGEKERKRKNDHRNRKKSENPQGLKDSQRLEKVHKELS